ncbi:MAG TPA: hypothetical protein VJ867_09185 [Gemmatimonadaceae bacterium]|nr:hypothetical protein [Gemmatimonadaceae bacterium]
MTIDRRDFLARAAQLGAFSLVNSGSLADLLSRNGRSLTSPGLTDGALGMNAAEAAKYPFTWRMLGPFRGGRCASATGVPGRPNEFYFGAVNGGVWKSIDAGRVWTPVFDAQPVASIGAIVVAPSAPETVYVGTGESTLRDSAGFGNGVYKSTNGGKSWTHLGLEQTHHIGKIAVHPTDPNVVFVAAIGKLYAANPERGVFRSRDGGRTWTRVLGDENVGAVEVVIDPTNPRVVYAGLWNTRRPPWFTYAPTNGPGGGLFKSVDGGTTWRRLTRGLPAEGIGRTGIAVAPSNPRRVYAVVDCLLAEPGAVAPPPNPNAPPGAPPPQPPQQGGVFRSDDAGVTWTRLSNDPALWGRGWYFEKISVDPKHADVIYVPNVAVNRSLDGGHSWQVMRGSPGGDDYHQAWVSPDDTNTMVVASDQGTIITHNAKDPDPRNITWSSWLNQPTAQLYHISVDYRMPYWVTGAQQDSGAVAVRSRGKFAAISTREWEPIAPGGESGYTAGDPNHPGVVYGGNGDRWDLETNRPVPGTTAPQNPEGEAPREDWTQPLVLSKADPSALYYANQFLFRSTDGARTWTRISPDLTRKEIVVPPTLDAVAADQVDRNGKRGVIYTIAPSPVTAPMIWVGTDDGLIHLTLDGGGSWQNVTPSAVAPWSRVTMIAASKHDANVAYASVDRHQLQDYEPYIYRTRDQGKTWQRISNGLPAGVYVHVVKEDPVRRGLLFSGTERGAFVSFDDGDSWQPLQINLPVTSVRDFEIHDNDLVVGTHGRGIWVIDDIATLRQMTSSSLAGDAYLFRPSDRVVYYPTSDDGTPVQKDEPMTSQGPDGIPIDYYLKSSAPVTIEILDAAGTVVHHASSTDEPAPARRGRGTPGGLPRVSPLWQQTPEPIGATPGMHRVIWVPIRDTGGRGDGFGAPPTLMTGPFTVRLTVNGTSQTQTFTVRPDPRPLPT